MLEICSKLLNLENSLTFGQLSNSFAIVIMLSGSAWLHAEAEIWLPEGPPICWRRPALLQLSAFTFTYLSYVSEDVLQWRDKYDVIKSAPTQFGQSTQCLWIRTPQPEIEEDDLGLQSVPDWVSQCLIRDLEVLIDGWSMEKYPRLVMWICCHGHGFVRFGQYVITRCSAQQQPYIIPSSCCAWIIAIWQACQNSEYISFRPSWTVLLV